MLINNDKMPESYLAHHVFDDIEYMRDFYDRLSDRCFYFIPSGTRGITNYASYIYMSYRGTLKSIKMLLENGNINDALVLVRKLYDDVFMDSIDCGINPPDGSQSWIAPYAQEAFDKYIAPRKDLSTFIIEHCCLDIASNR